MRQRGTLNGVLWCVNPYCPEFDRPLLTRAARVIPERADSLPPLPPAPMQGSHGERDAECQIDG